MKYLTQYILIITITVLFVSNCVLAQTNPPQQNLPNASVNSAAFDTKPFDLQQEKLPSNYKGHNPELLFNFLYKLEVYREEWESMADFRERFKSSSQKISTEFIKTVGGMHLDSIFAFQAADVFPKYDENTRTVDVSFNGRAAYFTGQISNLYINKDNLVGSFRAQNVYGAQADVKEIENETLQILMSNGKNFLLPSSKSYDETVGAIFAIDAEDAAQARKNVKVLIICKLVEPYARYKEDIIQATLSNPQQTKIKVKALVTEVLEIWYYDAVMGKIYYKQKPR